MLDTIKLSTQKWVTPFHIHYVGNRVAEAYQAFCNRLNQAAADKLFLNTAQYLQTLNQQGEGSTVLQMHRGLSFTVRRNIGDAESLREAFAERSGVRRLRLGSKATVVDVGGNIGGFSVYAVKALRAARVVTYESSADNYRLLSQNVVNNTLDHRITSVHASVESLETVLRQHKLKQVDLLRVDTSRDSLEWLINAPHQLLKQVKRIILRVPSEQSQAIAPVLKHLRNAGYSLRRRNNAVYATL